MKNIFKSRFTRSALLVVLCAGNLVEAAQAMSTARSYLSKLSNAATNVFRPSTPAAAVVALAPHKSVFSNHPVLTGGAVLLVAGVAVFAGVEAWRARQAKAKFVDTVTEDLTAAKNATKTKAKSVWNWFANLFKSKAASTSVAPTSEKSPKVTDDNVVLEKGKEKASEETPKTPTSAAPVVAQPSSSANSTSSTASLISDAKATTATPVEASLVSTGASVSSSSSSSASTATAAPAATVATTTTEVAPAATTATTEATPVTTTPETAKLAVNA